MKINAQNLSYLLTLLNKERLLSDTELNLASAVKGDDFAFSLQLAAADSIHYHIHVPDIEQLPTEQFLQLQAVIENKKEGYIKYGFPGGIKFIFSHIPVAQKEQLSKCSEQAYLDHIGIDIRSDDKQAYIVFQQIPLVAAQHDYYFKRQGDGVEVVKCCHMQVKEKYWVYAGQHINYEFAFGPLVIHENGFGIDLRPANPFNKPVAEESAGCCTEQKSAPKIFINQEA